MKATNADLLAAAIATKIVVREDHVEHSTYLVRTLTGYDPCTWCADEPEQAAVIAIWWDRGRDETDGHTVCCPALSCLHDAINHALNDGSDPENITVEYPELAQAAPSKAA